MNNITLETFNFNGFDYYNLNQIEQHSTKARAIYSIKRTNCFTWNNYNILIINYKSNYMLIKQSFIYFKLATNY